MSDDVQPDGGAEPDTVSRNERADPEQSRFVVPDPAAPPEGEPTTFIPPTYQDGPPTATHLPTVEQRWTAPGEPGTPQPVASGYPLSPPTAPPQQWDPAQGSAMPVGGWGAAQQQGYQQPNQYQQAPYQQAPYQQPQHPYPQSPPAQSAKPARSGRAAAIVLAVLIVALVAIGGFFGFRALDGSAAAVEGTVDRCHIASDGTLSASGTVTSGEETDMTLEIRFEDVTNSTEVDRATVDVSGPTGQPIPWSASGQAPDDVVRVTCLMGPAD